MHNVNKFYGETKPSWEPVSPTMRHFDEKFMNICLKGRSDHVYLFDGLFDNFGVEGLIKDFDSQEKYPVGIDGYCNSVENAGSFRAMGWSESIAQQITGVVKKYLPEKFDELTPLDKSIQELTFLGSTPWVRFMKYKNGGMHVPHYDAPFVNTQEKYATLFSWVLYLNTPEKGGDFTFIVDSKNNGIDNPSDWDRSDWSRMAESEKLEEWFKINPQTGRLLVFPHWLCHQVEELISGSRYIIRGDIAYSY